MGIASNCRGNFSLLMCTVSVLRDEKKFKRLVIQTMNVLNTSFWALTVLNWTLKMVKVVNFMLCVF